VTQNAARAKDGRPPVKSSPALSLANQPKTSIKTRRVAMLLLPGASIADVDAIREALTGQGAKVEVISDAMGPVRSAEGRPIDVDKTFFNTSSVLYDAVVVPGGPGAEALAANASAIHFVRESFRHAKPVGATNEGIAVLTAAKLPGIDLAARGQGVAASKGVVSARGKDLGAFTQSFVDALRAHRHFDRDLDSVPA
jgi:catalase